VIGTASSGLSPRDVEKRSPSDLSRHVPQSNLCFCVENRLRTFSFYWHRQLVWPHMSPVCIRVCHTTYITKSHCCVSVLPCFFFWILLTLTGEVIEDFLRNERGEHDVTATPSEPIIQAETVQSQHLVNGGGKPLSRLTLPGRM
jgi:hypothetical protein